MGGEESRAGFGDVHVVFEADAEGLRVVGEVDAGLVGEGHVGLEGAGVAADEVVPLVHIHADAVADAVGEVLVVGAEAGGGDDVAGGGVDGLHLDAGASGGEGCGLGLVDDVEDSFLAVGGGAVDEGAGDVGLVTLDEAAVVDEDDLVLADDLRGGRAVGLGGVGADLTGGFAANAAAGVGGVDEIGEVAVGLAGSAGLVDGFVDGEGDVVGELHEGELGGGFDAAAACDDGDAGGDLARCDGFGNAVGEDELHALVEGEWERGGSGGTEGVGEQCVGVSVFVPGVDARRSAVG